MSNARGKSPSVLLVGGALGGGGAERRMVILAERIFGGRAQIAVLRHADDPDAVASPVHSLGWTGASSYLRVICKLRSLLRRRSFDAVVSFGLFPIIFSWIASFCLPQRPALVAMEITRPKMERALWRSFRRRVVLTWLRKRAYQGSDIVAANSIDGYREVVDHLGVPEERARRVYNLLDFSALEERAGTNTARPRDAAGGRFTVCMVGRLVAMKQVDHVIQSFAQMLSTNWTLNVVGDGPELEGLRALAKTFGVADRVHFLGWHSDPHHILAASDLLVLASEYEGFSNSVIEAMVIGVPVVSSFCSSDTREMAAKGALAGFEPGDLSELAKLVEHLASNGAAREDMVTKARMYVRRMDVKASLLDYERLVLDGIEWAESSRSGPPR